MQGQFTLKDRMDVQNVSLNIEVVVCRRPNSDEFTQALCEALENHSGGCVSGYLIEDAFSTKDGYIVAKVKVTGATQIAQVLGSLWREGFFKNLRDELREPVFQLVASFGEFDGLGFAKGGEEC